MQKGVETTSKSSGFFSTASAAELVAGAIQDHERGVIVGTTTYGRASVQSIVELRGDDALKLTTTLYFTPRGRTIQAQGITPGVVVRQPVAGGGLPVVLEQNIEGYIPTPGETRKPSEDASVAGMTTADIVVPRGSSSNPIGAGDLALSVAYQLPVDDNIPLPRSRASHG